MSFPSLGQNAGPMMMAEAPESRQKCSFLQLKLVAGAHGRLPYFGHQRITGQTQSQVGEDGLTPL